MSCSGVILFGAGDLALEVANILEDVNTTKALSEHFRPKRITDVVDQKGQIPRDLADLLDEGPEVHTALSNVENISSKQLLICVGDACDREKIYNEFQGLPVKPYFLTLIHPSAYVAESARIGAGVIIAPLAYIGPQAIVEANVMINVSASIGHHVEIGRSSVVSPNVAVNGRARLDRAVFVGSGAVVAPHSHIGCYTKISHGAVVSGKTGIGFLLAGNPAKGRQMFKAP